MLLFVFFLPRWFCCLLFALRLPLLRCPCSLRQLSPLITHTVPSLRSKLAAAAR